MNDALIYAEGYFEILNADDETEPNGSIEGVMIKGTFDLQNVDFAYPNGHMLYMTLTCGLKLENNCFSWTKRSREEYCNQSSVQILFT